MPRPPQSGHRAAPPDGQIGTAIHSLNQVWQRPRVQGPVGVEHRDGGCPRRQHPGVDRGAVAAPTTRLARAASFVGEFKRPWRSLASAGLFVASLTAPSFGTALLLVADCHAATGNDAGRGLGFPR